MAGQRMRLPVLAAAYLVQGITYGFAGLVLLPTLAQQGVPLETQTGILALGGLPWIFKAVWGPLLDRVRDHRFGDTRWLVAFAQLAMAASVVVLAATDDLTSHTGWLAYVWLAHNVCLSLQDVATDALALDVLRDEERGRANGVMLGSHHVGSEAVGAMLLGAAVAAYDLQAALWLHAAIVATLAATPFLIDRPPLTTQPQSPGMLIAAMRTAFTRKGVGLALVIALLAYLADQTTSAVAPHFLVTHLHWTPEQIQAEIAPVLLVSLLLGFGVATVVSDRLGHARAATIGTVGLGLTWASFAMAEGAWSSHGVMLTMICVQSIFTSLFMVGLHALFMDLTDPRVRATQFVIFMALLNVPRSLAPAIAPDLLASLGFVGLYLVAGAFQVSLWALLARLRTR